MVAQAQRHVIFPRSRHKIDELSFDVRIHASTIIKLRIPDFTFNRLTRTNLAQPRGGLYRGTDSSGRDISPKTISLPKSAIPVASVRGIQVFILAHFNDLRPFKCDRLNLSSVQFAAVTPPCPDPPTIRRPPTHYFPYSLSFELRIHAEGDDQIHPQSHLHPRLAWHP